MREHTHYPGVHAGWIVPTIAPPPTVSDGDMRVFRRGLSLISDRDRAILQSRAVGLSIPEVAAAYGVAPHTVSNVITKVFDMLGVDVGVRGDPVYRMGRMMRAAYILGRVEGEG